MPTTLPVDSVVTNVRFRSLGVSPDSVAVTPPLRTVLRPNQPIIITIDGPAGTGKSSVARQLAHRLGLDFLDTGAMYRATAAISLDHNLGLADPATLVATVANADLHFDWTTDPPAILAWGKPINERIRDADVTRTVSPISTVGPLREHMVRKQRLIAQQHPRLVSEGRDQGSVVFPNAYLKIYLTATCDERARRRVQQLIDAGRPADLSALTAEIAERDHRDMHRAVGPLVMPQGASVLDTSALSFDAVVDSLERMARGHNPSTEANITPSPHTPTSM